MPVYNWSKTPANNGSADPTINWSPQMAPSAVSPSGRALMTAVANWRDDIAGAIMTTGTSTAYSLSSNSGFTQEAQLAGQLIAFTPHVTNGAGPVTLNVDGVGSFYLRSAPNADLLVGVLIQGTPYVAVLNQNDGAFYLRGFYGNPYNVPLLGGMDYWGTTAPNSSFIFPQGQAISRTTYAAAFAQWGTKFGAGDGATTFNVPDKTGRVSAMIESVATRLTSTYFGGDSTKLGSVGNSNESHKLVASEIPSISFSGSGSGSGTVNMPGTVPYTNGIIGQDNSAPQGGPNYASSTAEWFGAGSLSVTVGSVNVSGSSSNTGGNSHAIVQPTITCNYIIRII